MSDDPRTMKIRFTTSIADTRGWSYDYGEVADVPVEMALRFIQTGHAEAAKESGDETATLPGPRPRKA